MICRDLDRKSIKNEKNDSYGDFFTENEEKSGFSDSKDMLRGAVRLRKKRRRK